MHNPASPRAAAMSREREWPLWLPVIGHFLDLEHSSALHGNNEKPSLQRTQKAMFTVFSPLGQFIHTSKKHN